MRDVSKTDVYIGDYTVHQGQKNWQTAASRALISLYLDTGLRWDASRRVWHQAGGCVTLEEEKREDLFLLLKISSLPPTKNTQKNAHKEGEISKKKVVISLELSIEKRKIPTNTNPPFPLRHHINSKMYPFRLPAAVSLALEGSEAGVWLAPCAVPIPQLFIIFLFTLLLPSVSFTALHTYSQPLRGGPELDNERTALWASWLALAVTAAQSRWKGKPEDRNFVSDKKRKASEQSGKRFRKSQGLGFQK